VEQSVFGGEDFRVPSPRLPAYQVWKTPGGKKHAPQEGEGKERRKLGQGSHKEEMSVTFRTKGTGKVSKGRTNETWPQLPPRRREGDFGGRRRASGGKA